MGDVASLVDEFCSNSSKKAGHWPAFFVPEIRWRSCATGTDTASRFTRAFRGPRPFGAAFGCANRPSWPISPAPIHQRKLATGRLFLCPKFGGARARREPTLRLVSLGPSVALAPSGQPSAVLIGRPGRLVPLQFIKESWPLAGFFCARNSVALVRDGNRHCVSFHSGLADRLVPLQFHKKKPVNDRLLVYAS